MATLKSDLGELNVAGPSGNRGRGLADKDGYVTPRMSWARWALLGALIAWALSGLVKVLMS